MSGPIYKYHVFCCTTTRPPDHPKPSCGPKGAGDLAGYIGKKVWEMELPGVRVQQSNCLGRCDLGPTLVVYPEGTWYAVRSTADLDEIIDSHLTKGRVVERLVIR
jgi:(2Fe-2S) ferredoxin